MSTVNYTKLTDRNVSFGLIRTNPKLTSNLKISIDSAGEIWMNSIDANSELANQKYKRVPISPLSNHEVNVFKFYDSGKTPTKVSFAIGKPIRTDVMARDLKDQYDFELYTSGAKYLSALYPEKFCYFAPLYLDEVIPEYFVILRMPGASNYSAGEWRQKLSDPNFSQTDFANDIFQNARIVKSFSLRETSNIGKYIRNIRRNPRYTPNPLYVNFKKDSYSLYRGISIKSGTYVEIPEKLDQVFQKAIGQLSLEKYVVGGYERNNVVHPKILNLEFLFSDETSSDYSINRYFGFYCNAVDLSKFEIDLEKMYQNDEDNSTPLERIYLHTDEVSVKIENPNGVVLRGRGVQEDLSFLKDSLKNSDSLIFPYIKTKGDDLHFIKSGLNENQAFLQTSSDIKFTIDDTKFDLGKTFGPDRLFSQIEAKEINQNTRSTVLLTINSQPEHLDTIRLYHQNGRTQDPFDSVGKYDDFVFVRNYLPTDTDYSLDYINPGQIQFSIPVDPNLSPARFIPETPNLQNIQYISTDDESLWEWTGSAYTEATVSSPVGSPVYFYMDGITDPNSTGQVFTPNIKTDSSSSILIQKSELTFAVTDVGIFAVGDRVKIMPGETRYMLGQVVAIDSLLNSITVNITETKGGGTYSSWIIQKMQLGVQHVSSVNGSLWQTNGKKFTQGSVGTRIYVNADGADLSVITKRFQAVLEKLEYAHIVTSRFENSIFIQANAPGESYGSLAIRNKTGSSFLLINGQPTSNLVNADGGFIGNQVSIPVGNIQRLTPLLDSLIIKTHQNWSKISRVSNSAASVNNGFGPTDRSTIKNYLERATIKTVEPERILVDYNKVEVRDLFNPSIGLLSLFEIKDFDFDTYRSDYAKFPEIDLYQYYFLPPNTKILDFQKYVYTLSGTGVISVNGQIYETDEINPIIWQSRKGLSQYTVLSGDPVVKLTNLKPYQFSNEILRRKAVTTSNNLFPFIEDEIITPIIIADKSNSFNFINDFRASLAGYYANTEDSILIEDITGPSGFSFVEKTLTVEAGLLFKADQLVKLVALGDYNLDTYLIGTVVSYTEVTEDDLLVGKLTIVITQAGDTVDTSPGATFSIANLFRIDEDSLFPVFRMKMESVSTPSYITARLENYLVEISAPSNTQNTIYTLMRILETVGEEISLDAPWTLYTVIKTESAIRSDIGILDADRNLQNFTGFFGLGADHSTPDKNSTSYEDRDVYLTNSLRSEYFVYLENFSKQFSSDNRLAPYISKWGISNSTDARGNIYRLNTDICFGKDNFGPSHREKIPTTEKLTHEWFYIESKFNYALDPNLLRKNYYYFDSPFDVNRLISENSYFEKYFTYVPTYSGKEIDRPQFRYSKLIRNQFTNQYETVFNGAKFVFSELNERGDILRRTNRFADYNFSILLKPIEEDLSNPQKPVNYRIIENTDAKSILILIELALSGRDKIGHDLLFNSDELPGAVLNQANLLDTLYIRSETYIFPEIDVIYTCTDDQSGDSEFSKLSVNNNDVYSLTSPFLGTAIDTSTAEVISDFTPQPGQTVLVKKGDGSKEVILTMPGSKISQLVSAGKLQTVCLAKEESPSGPVEISYSISTKKRLSFDGELHYPILIFKGTSNDQIPFSFPENNKLAILPTLSTWTSTLGDFRLEFNDGISNLSYAFLYAGKDKKFNTVKSAFSTVKLPKGISLSPNQTVDSSEGLRSLVQTQSSDFAFLAKDLAGLPKTAFKLNQFINPISGTVSGTKSFAPIMLINKNGVANILVSISADLANLDKTGFIRNFQNSRITDHAIKSVSSTELIIAPAESPKNLLKNVYTISITSSGPVEQAVDSSFDLVGDTVRIRFFSRDALLTYGIDDTVILVNDALSYESERYILGTVIRLSDTADAYAEVEIYEQNQLFTAINSGWRVTRRQGINALGLSIRSNASSLPEIFIENSDLPVIGTADDTWTNYHQQFQLFGGKNYFSNLFENISFANFIELIESESEILSWETYTNGERVLADRTNNKVFTIQVEVADRIEKKTIVKPIEQVVETSNRIETGGYEQSEVPSEQYEVFRYSGEYEAIFKPVSGFNYETRFGDFTLDGANSKLNTQVSNFFTMPEFAYVKFSDRTILDLESATKFSANYPLIGESPIDYDKFNILSSSWDFNYHFKYSTKTTKTAIPGTNRIIEDYSFLSKLINLPLSLTIEPATFQPVSNKEFEIDDNAFAATDNDLIYSVYPNDVRLKINFSRLLAKNLLNKGLGEQFNNFFKDSQNQVIENDEDLLGSLTLTQYKIDYCQRNLNKLFELDQIECYQRPNYSIPENSITFSNLEYSELNNQGYSAIQNFQINNPKSKVLTCIFPKSSSTGLNLVPKLKIKYI